MPLSTIYEIPRLNMTFTKDSLQEVTTSTEYYEDNDYYFELSKYKPLPQATYFFRFHNGSLLTHRAGVGDEVVITIKVDLVEGKMYQLGKNGKKWLALCRFDEKYDQLTLFPADRRKKAPVVKNEDRMEYTFYKEFDHDYKEYL